MALSAKRISRSNASHFAAAGSAGGASGQAPSRNMHWSRRHPIVLKSLLSGRLNLIDIARPSGASFRASAGRRSGVRIAPSSICRPCRAPAAALEKNAPLAAIGIAAALATGWFVREAYAELEPAGASGPSAPSSGNRRQLSPPVSPGRGGRRDVPQRRPVRVPQPVVAKSEPASATWADFGQRSANTGSRSAYSRTSRHSAISAAARDKASRRTGLRP